MRLFMRAVLVVGLISCLLAPLSPAAAQLVREHDITSLRSFHGGATRIRRSFQSDAEAKAVLRLVLAAAGLAGIEDRIIIRASAETDNAEAYIENNERLIFYNAEFMQEIAAKSKNYWSMVAILAHEVGHHVRFHTALTGREHEFELEADYQAGFILRRMGAKLEEAQAPFRLFPAAATPTHPGRAQRVQAVTLGWTDGGAVQAPGVPGAGAPVTGPVAAAPSVVPAKPTPPPKATPALMPPKPAPCDTIRMADGSCLAAGSGAAFRDNAKDGKPCPECPEMVVVPAGSFMMGSTPAEIAALTREYPDGKDWWPAEGPQRRVTIARPFAVGRFEVSFAEWDACVAAGGCKHKPDDSKWGRGRQPVINVSWDDITKEYLPWLSARTGQTYRLLSEAEWEYAARAGTTAAFWWGKSISPVQANYNGNYTFGGGPKGEYRQRTVAVDNFKPNAWGLHNVHGNVWEWVEDCWNGNYNGAPIDGSAWTTGDCGRRVVRGGSWDYDPQSLRAALRIRSTSDYRNVNLGFRVGRTLTP